MNKCKLCDWTTETKGYDETTRNMRKHWAARHKQEATQLQIQLADFEYSKRWCLTCGVSQLSAGSINTCSKCQAWFCPAYECIAEHAKCGPKMEIPRAA